jgi:hypothetical protein
MMLVPTLVVLTLVRMFVVRTTITSHVEIESGKVQ